MIPPSTSPRLQRLVHWTGRPAKGRVPTKRISQGAGMLFGDDFQQRNTPAIQPGPPQTHTNKLYLVLSIYIRLS